MVAAGAGLLGIAGLFFASTRPYAPFAVLVGVMLALSSAQTGQLGLSSANRVAIGVGGLAIVGLLIGLERFNSVRAAASVTVVILAIGVLTFPGAQAVVGVSNVGRIIQWMALILGVNSLSEAAVEIQKTRSAAAATRDQMNQIQQVHGDS
jgi:hypothetical protein